MPKELEIILGCLAGAALFYVGFRALWGGTSIKRDKNHDSMGLDKSGHYNRNQLDDFGGSGGGSDGGGD